MQATWRTVEMHRWAQLFLEEERQAGRSYRLVVVAKKTKLKGSTTKWAIAASDPMMSDERLKGLMALSARRHDMPLEDEWFDARMRDLQMAFMTYIGDFFKK